MDVETIDVVTPDGRNLRVDASGDSSGLPVFTLHGMPGSRLLEEPSCADAQSRGIRLIGYDRPGYGGSTPQPGRSFADCAADVRTIADALGYDRFGVWGISGGGPHALACAALLPDRAVAVGVLASSAPFGAEGLDYTAGMGDANADDVALFLDDPVAAREKSRADRLELLEATPQDLYRIYASLLSPVDAAVFSQEMAEYFVRCNLDGLAQGDEGWWDDAVAHMEPWGFDLADIRVPVQLWHGRHDQFVPFSHGEWLAQRIPGVDAHLTDVDGHVTLGVNRVPEVHAWILEHF
jgi:pimeloyl-ACP methyl ester carboxylesterase